MNFVKQDLLLLNHLIRKSSGGILAIKKEGIPSSLIAKNNKNYYSNYKARISEPSDIIISQKPQEIAVKINI